MAPYHIRQYQETDRPQAVSLFSQGMLEHVPTTFRHILKLPRTLVFFLGVVLAIFLVSGSLLLALVGVLTLLVALRFLVKYPWTQYVVDTLNTDMADITKSYLSKRDSCFWVAESEGQVVGTVGAQPVEDPTLQKKQLQLFRLSVASEHRGQGVAKTLVRTVLQFARDKGYSEVVLSTSSMQHAALALYLRMGFQKMQHYFPTNVYALLDFSIIQLTYRIPSAQVS